MSLLFCDIEKRFRGGPTIRAAFESPADRFSVTVLFGPSGCGKTTILRCLAGLERPDHGVIRCGDETWLDTSTRAFVSPQQRGVGFLFQDYALFPHLSVGSNVGYGLRRLPRAERRRRVGEMLDMMRLSGLERRSPRTLSGGEQQRIALARVLVRRPRLLLLDEPLSALDSVVRESLRRELRQLLTSFGIPCFIVTHDRHEAMTLGDQLMVLLGGTVQQSGPLDAVFSRPANTEIARLLGIESVIPAKVVHADNGLATAEVEGGKTRLVVTSPLPAGQKVWLCIRGEDVSLHTGAGGTTSARNQIPARVISLEHEGPVVRVVLDGGFHLVALVTRNAAADLGLQPGAMVTAHIKAPAIHVVPR